MPSNFGIDPDMFLAEGAGADDGDLDGVSGGGWSLRHCRRHGATVGERVTTGKTLGFKLSNLNP